MGSLTHAELVTEATELAGNTGLTVRARVWLSLVLRELFERFPLPVVPSGGMINDAPITPQTITAGTQTVTLGNGSSSIVRSVRRAWICTNGQADFTELAVEHSTTMDAPLMAYTGVSGISRGRPTRMVVHVASKDIVTAYFSPIPDKTYALWFQTEGQLAALSTYSGATVNGYPNDMTVLQGVFAMCLKHQQDERAASEWSEFMRMASSDRVRYGNMNNAHTKLRLSPRTFARRVGSNPWDWMGPK